MKKIMSFIWIAFVFFACNPHQPVPTILDGKVLILGDSITQDGRYVSVVEYKLFKKFPNTDFDILSIGLSSETVSGLSEPDHDPRRPCVLGRLDSALHTLKPDYVIACYGMNDGIYHPQSPERLAAFQNGYKELIKRVHATGADVFILTPPFFDNEQKPNAVTADADVFGYRTPFVNYNDVLADYAEWLLSLDMSNVRVADLNTPMKDYVAAQKSANPEFCLSKDGVHPGLAGHILMADICLNMIGVPVDDGDPLVQEKALQDDVLFQMVQERRKTRSMAWLKFIGNDINREIKALPVQQAETQAQELKVQILSELTK